MRWAQAATGRVAAALFTLAFSPDGKMLASRDGDKTVCFLDVATGKEIRRFTTTDAIKGRIAGLTFSPDGQTLVTVDGVDKTVCFWERATGKLLHKQAQGTERERGRGEFHCGITFW